MILVFKTSVDNRQQAMQLKPSLDQLLSKNSKWNFDLSDCDRILRVDCPEDISSLIIHTLNTYGFDCAELD